MKTVTCLACMAVLALAPVVRADAPPADLATKLREVVTFDGINDPKTTLGDALGMLTKNYALPFDVDEAALRAAGVEDILALPVADKPFPKMKDVRLETVLRKLLARVGNQAGDIDFLVRRDVIEITTWGVVKEAVWGTEYEGPYLPLVHAKFDGQSLTDALKDLAEQSDFNVVIDARVADKAKDAKVTARLANAPLDTAVALLADMAELKPVLKDNMLYVTSKENAAKLEQKRREQFETDPNAASRNGGGRPRVVQPRAGIM